MTLIIVTIPSFIQHIITFAPNGMLQLSATAASPDDDDGQKQQPQFDTFFMHHDVDAAWVRRVIDRLHASTDSVAATAASLMTAASTAAAAATGGGSGLRCGTPPGGASSSLLLLHSAGLLNAAKTVVVLTPEFVRDVWLPLVDARLVTAGDIEKRRRDLVVVVLRPCHVPRQLVDVAVIDVIAVGAGSDVTATAAAGAMTADWWPQLVALLAAGDVGSAAGGGSTTGSYLFLRYFSFTCLYPGCPSACRSVHLSVYLQGVRLFIALFICLSIMSKHLRFHTKYLSACRSIC